MSQRKIHKYAIILLEQFITGNNCQYIQKYSWLCYEWYFCKAAHLFNIFIRISPNHDNCITAEHLVMAMKIRNKLFIRAIICCQRNQLVITEYELTAFKGEKVWLQTLKRLFECSEINKISFQKGTKNILLSWPNLYLS